jgi:hypothetical protein
VGGTESIAAYSGRRDISEAGPERIFHFELSEPARVTVWVDEANGVDVDGHLLDTLSVNSDGMATDCVARGNDIAEADLGAGTHWISIDTYDSMDFAGSFVVRMYAVGASGFAMPIAEGIEWRAWRRDGVGGGSQVMHSVFADPSVDGVSMKPALPGSALTTGATALAQEIRPVAATNASFFKYDQGFHALNLAIADGVTLSQNTFNDDPHGAVGMNALGEPIFKMLNAGVGWPEASQAQSGLPTLVREGVATSVSDWNAEGLSSASFFAANPRTVLGIDESGAIFMATFDGRRTNARGMSFVDLGDFLVNEWSAEYAVNLDGGGSTTMWVDHATPSGVVNYPSDGNSEGESMSHDGARAVYGGVLFYGNPYNHPPRLFRPRRYYRIQPCEGPGRRQHRCHSRRLELPSQQGSSFAGRNHYSRK